MATGYLPVSEGRSAVYSSFVPSAIGTYPCFLTGAAAATLELSNTIAHAPQTTRASIGQQPRIPCLPSPAGGRGNVFERQLERAGSVTCARGMTLTEAAPAVEEETPPEVLDVLGHF